MVTNLKKKTNKKGFTLVELVMVIAIIAILAAIAVPTVTNVIQTANTNVDTANAQTVELAIKSAYAERVSGTWNGVLTSGGTAIAANALTVSQALQHEGITLPTSRVTGADWGYHLGRVRLDPHTAHDSTFTYPDPNNAASFAGLTVETVAPPVPTT